MREPELTLGIVVYKKGIYVQWVAAKLAALNKKRILTHKKPLVQKLSSIKIKVYMLHATWYTFPRIPRPQPASLA